MLAPIWNSSSRTKFEFEQKRRNEKQNRKGEEKECRPRKPPRPARTTPASQPNRPANPSCRPSMCAAHELAQRVAHAHALVCLTRSHCLLDLACQPPMATVSSSSPTPQPPMRPAPDSGGRAGQGSCPRHGPVSPLAPRPCDLRANHPTPQCRSMPTVHHQPSAHPP